MKARWAWAAVAGLALLAAGWIGAPPDVRGQKEEKPAVTADTAATKLYYGVKACSNDGCHSSPPKAPPTPKDLICRCVEAKEWIEEDKHQLAFNALEGERGKRIATALDYKGGPETWSQCVACHAVSVDPKAEKHFSFTLTEGVNCVACHGPYAEWVSDHQGLNAPTFRGKSRDVKWSVYGMKDLWDPLKRAELCASCHVGNLKEGKFVSHEMYAAGHPALPSFEVGTFSNEMPRHWQYLREKKKPIQGELGHDPKAMEETHLMLVGAAVSLRESMRLIRDDAASDGVKKGDALDLAHFDCFACHHDLKQDSWRLRRGYEKGRKPGRVGLRPWPSQLVKLAIVGDQGKADADLKAFDSLLNALKKEFDARPYGDPAAVAKAAAALEDYADKLATSLNRSGGKRRVFEKRHTQELLAAIPAVFKPTERLYDYDTARQVSWVYELLRRELVRAGSEKELKDDDPAFDKGVKELEPLEKALKLRLPSKKKGEKYEPAYTDTLSRIAGWDPFKSKKLFEGLKP